MVGNTSCINRTEKKGNENYYNENVTSDVYNKNLYEKIKGKSIANWDEFIVPRHSVSN